MRKVLSAVMMLWSVMLVSQVRPTLANVEERVNQILSKMTLEEKIDMIGGTRGFYIRGYERLGIPEQKMADGPAGVRNYGPATTIGGIGLAATFDAALVERVGAQIGRDARARGVHYMLAPGVNIHRAPMNGRNFEYYGEDPFLASRTAVAYIEGIQKQGVIATVKHYMGNNSEFDRHNTNSIIDERTMREIYLPSFEAAVKEAHVGSIMDSYNLVNGVHSTQNGILNNDIAKKEWGFDGVIMSDWDGTYDGIAAANGGLDLEMPSGKFMNQKTLLPAIQSGKVSQATIDDKVRRILRKAIEFGFFDRPQFDPSIPVYDVEAHKTALEAARESMVLLKNEGGMLPLDKSKIKTLALLGPDGYPAQTTGGGSGRTLPFSGVSYVEGLANYLAGSTTVLFHRALPAFNDLVQATEFKTSTGEVGLNAEYFPTYSSTGMSGNAIATRTEKVVNYGGDTRGTTWPANANAARWTATYTATLAGTYHVMVNGLREKSGYRLYIDDKLAIDNWENGKAALDYVSLPFALASTHAVRLEYWRKDRAPGVQLAIAASSTMVAREAQEIASRADAIIVAAGFDWLTETEDVDRSFRLPPGEDELIAAAVARGKPVIVVMTSGGNVDSSAWIDKVPAYLQAWYPGQEGGTALAQILFGDYNPSGRLPVTFEKRWEDNATAKSYYPQHGRDITYSEGIFVGYRHFDKDNVEPLFPFGFGLSYTTFAYKNIAVEQAKDKNGWVVSFDVTNTGNRTGADVAQAYVGHSGSSVPMPVRELKGFQRIELNPRETRRVEIRLDNRAFSHWDVKAHDWREDDGKVEIQVGRSSREILLRRPMMRVIQ